MSNGRLLTIANLVEIIHCTYSRLTRRWAHAGATPSVVDSTWNASILGLYVVGWVFCKQWVHSFREPTQADSPALYSGLHRLELPMADTPALRSVSPALKLPDLARSKFDVV